MEVKMEQINNLVPNGYCLRKNALSLAPLMKSIQTYGFLQPILVNQNNVIITGNNRYEAAVKLNINEVPVIKVQMSDEQMEQYAIIDNQVQQLTGWNFSAKKTLLQKHGIDIGAYGLSDEMREIKDIDNFFNEDEETISLF